MNKTKIFTLLLLLMIVNSACNSNLKEEIKEENPIEKENEPENHPVINEEENEIENQNLPYINYEDNELEGTVAYKRCNPQELTLSGIQFPQGEAYLFKDFIPEKIEMELIESKSWIILFDSKTDIVTFLRAWTDNLKIPVVGFICNFPDFAKAWNIPEEGIKVYFEGLSYCPSWGSIANIFSTD